MTSVSLLLPWVSSSTKHLGSTITNDIRCLMDQDIMAKRAIFITKNNETNQEFHYAHAETKVWLNHRPLKYLRGLWVK